MLTPNLIADVGDMLPLDGCKTQDGDGFGLVAGVCPNYIQLGPAAVDDCSVTIIGEGVLYLVMADVPRSNSRRMGQCALLVCLMPLAPMPHIPNSQQLYSATALTELARGP